MKSMLSGVAFKLPSPEIGDLFGDPVAYVQKLRTHGEELTKALEAALAVIDAENDYDEFAKSRGGIRASKRLLDATRELETALDPFKVAGKV